MESEIVYLEKKLRESATNCINLIRKIEDKLLIAQKEVAKKLEVPPEKAIIFTLIPKIGFFELMTSIKLDKNSIISQFARQLKDMSRYHGECSFITDKILRKSRAIDTFNFLLAKLSDVSEKIISKCVNYYNEDKEFYKCVLDNLEDAQGALEIVSRHIKEDELKEEIERLYKKLYELRYF